MMPVRPDPSALSKERLKSELRAHNVELPGGNPTKDVYVQLYVKAVSRTEAPDAFSSDEELPPPVVSRFRRSRSSGKKSASVLEKVDLAQISDEDLREQLLTHGVHAGPIVASTRTFYEKKLVKLMDNGTVLSESQSHSHSGEAEVYSDQEEEVPAPEPEATAEAELDPCPPPAQNSSSRHSSSQVEKTTAEPAPSEEEEELSVFTGLTASRRRPIRGASSLSVIHDRHSLQNQTSLCNSSATDACSAPVTTSPSSSAASSASCGAGSAPCEVTSRGASWWKTLLLLSILVVFVLLLLQAMEPNTAATFDHEED